MADISETLCPNGMVLFFIECIFLEFLHDNTTHVIAGKNQLLAAQYKLANQLRINIHANIGFMNELFSFFSRAHHLSKKFSDILE